MNHKLEIGLALMVLSMIGIICLQNIEEKQNANRPVPEVKKLTDKVKEPEISGSKTSADIKKPETENAVIPSKKQVKISE